MKSQNIRSLDSLGEKLRRLRTQKGMTQSEVSKGIVTRNMLSRIENGAALPSLETLAELADRLGVPCGFLLSESALEAFDLLDFKHELTKYTSPSLNVCSRPRLRRQHSRNIVKRSNALRIRSQSLS